MKKIVPAIVLLVLCNLAKSQTFNYTFNSTASPYSYTLKTTITIVGIKIVQIYYDDNKSTGSTGTFAYQLVVNYSNTVTGSNIPAAGTNFYQFQTDASSTKVGPQASIQNNSSTIPVSTGSGSINIGNNPTFTGGSASVFGYTVGNTYTDVTTLNRFGYFTLTLTVNAPGFTVAQSSTQTGVILPITLSQFSATPINNTVAVKWTTATETNSSFFTVERSATSTNFVALQNVAASGNSSALHNYSFTDYAPLAGVSYYRLKGTDIDGKFTYSSIVAVSTGAVEKISFYPSINTSNIVSFTSTASNNILDVYAISGAKVFTTTLSGNQVTLPNLAKGMYIFKISTANGLTQTSKYIQQ